MNKWMLMYLKDGKPYRVSRMMSHAKAMVRYIHELEVKDPSLSISLIKVVATNKVPT